MVSKKRYIRSNEPKSYHYCYKAAALSRKKKMKMKRRKDTTEETVSKGSLTQESGNLSEGMMVGGAALQRKIQVIRWQWLKQSFLPSCPSETLFRQAPGIRSSI